jgi:DNA-binding NarL/FixJ family response regulator
MAHTRAIRVVLADDHGFFRRRVGKLLASEPGILVIAEARNVQQAFEAVVRSPLDVDVLVLSEQIPGICCADVVRRLRSCGSQVGILILIASEDSPQIGPALNAGANGYVLKTSERSELVDSVRAVHEANSIRNWLQSAARKEGN